MQRFILIRFSQGAGLVHIYGIIEAEDAYIAAKSINSEVDKLETNGVLNNRYRLKDSKAGHYEWFLEEIINISSRPTRM